MKILVTGASGFIASQFVTDLLIAGHEIICCVRNTKHTQRIFLGHKLSFVILSMIQNLKSGQKDCRGLMWLLIV